VSAREHLDDAQMERLQIRVQKLEARLAAFPFLDGALVRDVALSSLPTRVAHRLGRVSKGFIVVSMTPSGSAFGLSTSSQPTDPQNAVNLESASGGTATLWFW